MNVRPIDDATVMDRLGAGCHAAGLDRLADRIHALRDLAADDLRAVDAALAELPRAKAVAVRGAHHLIDLGGKRLRPLCVALAARAGRGFDAAARELAVAVELVHNATLLHDDVVDVGEVRRGAPTTRALYGNAASIFAGDWLLTEALRRVRRADVPGTLDRLFDVIQDMILAESTQLENRGRLVADRETWLSIVIGKTAALFRWAMDAGARAGGLAEPHCQALETYGLHLGVAFQAVDDLLDLTGSPAATGKALFVDLRDGKITWPLILAVEREPSLVAVLEEAMAAPHGKPPLDALAATVVAVVQRTGSDDDCRRFARERAAAAVAALAPLPPSEARDALELVAAGAVERGR